MKVLLVGSGGREHAIAKAVKRSEVELYSVMKNRNPGIMAISEDVSLQDESDVAKTKQFAKEKGIDIAVIGPEAPLMVSVSDVLEDAGVPVVGPKKEVARLEFDKAWAREFMRDRKIDGLPIFEVCSTRDEVEKAVKDIGDVAIKPAGLTGGKGVKVMGDHLKDTNKAIEYGISLLDEHDVVVEERLIGEEFTLQTLVDGTHVAGMPAVQDYKRAYEGDLGPNTGGMGSYSERKVLPFMTDREYEQGLEIVKKTVRGVKKHTGVEYKGILYGQFILTADGIKLIEYNARFGDPEAMNVLPIMESDFARILEKVVDGSLGKLDFAKKATVCKYAVPEGYPDNPVANSKIEIEDTPGVERFYSNVNEIDGVLYTTTSRTVAFVGTGDTISEAEGLAQKALDRVKGAVFFRRDVGKEELIAKKVERVARLRRGNGQEG